MSYCVNLDWDIILKYIIIRIKRGETAHQESGCDYYDCYATLICATLSLFTPEDSHRNGMQGFLRTQHTGIFKTHFTKSLCE